MSENTNQQEKVLPVELGIENNRAVDISKNLLIQYMESQDHCETLKGIFADPNLTEMEKAFSFYMVGCYVADPDPRMVIHYINLKKERGESIPEHLNELVNLAGMAVGLENILSVSEAMFGEKEKQS